MNKALVKFTFGFLALQSVWFFPTETFASPPGFGLSDKQSIMSASLADASRPVPRSLRSIAFGNNFFVAIGPGMTILTSKDGKTWANHSSEAKNVTANINFASETYIDDGDAITFVFGYTNQFPSFPEQLKVKALREGLNDEARASLIQSASQKLQDYMAQLPHIPRRLYAVTFGDGVFVIVGESGEILTSHDAEHWTAQNTSLSETLTAAAWGNSRFVVVGDNGTILTSPDGLTWTKQNSGTAATLFGVAYGNDTFVALGDNSTILTSSDGIQWAPTDIGPQGMEAIAFGNGLFMGTSVDTDFPGKMHLDNRQTMISPDGKNWRAVKHPYPSQIGQGGAMTFAGREGGTTALSFCGGVFIAGSVEGIYSSVDGGSWKPSSDFYGFQPCYFGAAFGNGVFVAVGNGEAIDSKNHRRTSLATLATSKDAHSWELGPTPPSRLIWGSLLGDNRFRIDDTSRGGFFRFSLLPTAADTWTTPEKIPVSGCVYGNNVVFVNGRRPEVLSSKDGITWIRLAPTKADQPTLMAARDSQSAAIIANGVAIELNRQTYKLNLTANVGQSMEIQASTNLVDWETLATITNSAGIIKYTDQDAVNYPMRFYRLKLP